MKILHQKVDFSTLVRAEPDRVYDALTTAEGLNSWFTTNSTLVARPGGEIHFRWQDWGYERYTGEMGGPVLDAVRPKRFVFRWPVDNDTYLTRVEIDFDPVPEGTLVHLVESGYEDSPTGMQGLLNRVSGWAQSLTMMKFWVEHGVTY